MRTARLLFVNQYYPPDSSATAYLLGALTQDLARDYEVHVIAGRPSYSVGSAVPQPSGTVVHRVRSTRFDRGRMAGRMANYVTFLSSAALMAMRVPRPDVVIALTDPPLSGAIGMLGAVRHRSKLVCVCMDVFPDIAVALGRIQHPTLVWIWRAVNRLVRWRTDRVVVVGRDMYDKLEREGVPQEKLAFIPNWAGDGRPSLETRDAARDRMGWAGDFVLMHAGNVGLAQELGSLIEAAALLRARNDIRFVVLGEGAAKQSLRRRSDELGLRNVDFLPQLPRADAQPLMAAADIHLISLARGLAGTAVPSKVYGVLALGLPFLAAVEPGSEIDRIAGETRAGVTVIPGDGQALAATVLDLAQRRKETEAMGLRGRAEFERRYRPAHAMARYRELLDSLL